VGEFDLIARYFAQPAQALVSHLPAAAQPPLGIGDDCALLPALRSGEQMAVSTDTLLQGVHFFADVSPYSLGHKSLAVNLSDLAAMGARPLGFTLALTLPNLDEAWLSQFSEGLFRLAAKYQCPLVGGDTTRGPLSITITVFGAVTPETCLRRDRVREGDDLWVSGRLGAAAFAVQQIEAGVVLASNAPARNALEMPEPRLPFAQALVARQLSCAALDLSDGLLGDLAHLLSRSRLSGVVVDVEQLPLASCLGALPKEQAHSLALTGGDDYELLFSAAPKVAGELLALGQEYMLEVTRIGKFGVHQGIQLQRADGSLLSAPAHLASYQHFGH
jgi:thiamine-monophosphate kinase